MRIIVNPDQLHQLAQQLHRANNDLRGANANIGRIVGGMSLEIRARTNVDERAVAARRQAEGLANQAESLARFLEDRAEAFRRADEQDLPLLAAQLAWGNLLRGRGGGSTIGVPSGGVWGVLVGLGGVITQVSETKSTSLPHVKKKAFVDKPSLTDIQQGALGNCYMITAMGAVAYKRPDLIERAIILNDDGTYTVTFFDRNGNPVEITITDDFPVTEDGKSFAKSTQNDEIWVSLIEKAFVKWQTGGTSSKDYEEIAGGYAGDIMRALTGDSISRLNVRKASPEELGRGIQSALAAGKPVTVGILPTSSQFWNKVLGPLMRDDRVDYTHGDSEDLVGQHAYVVTGIHGDTVTLYNPWGNGPKGRSAEFTISLSDLKKYASPSGVEILETRVLQDSILNQAFA
jgi:hypothetical protein